MNINYVVKKYNKDTKMTLKNWKVISFLAIFMSILFILIFANSYINGNSTLNPSDFDGNWAEEGEITMTLQGTEVTVSGDGILVEGEELPWHQNEAITSIVFNGNIVANKDSDEMFYNLTSLTNLDLGALDTSLVTDMYQMFMGCKNLKTIDVSNFDTSNVRNMEYMFCETGLESIDLTNFSFDSAIDISNMFSNSMDLEDIIFPTVMNTQNLVDMHAMFECCSSLSEIDITKFNTSNVTNISSLFDECKSLEQIDLTNFDTSSVTNMCELFSECINLKSVDLSLFDTSNVTDMYGMFYKCDNLEEVIFTNLDTSNVVDASDMFYKCPKLKSLDLSLLDFSNVISMDGFVYQCESLEILKFNPAIKIEKIESFNAPFYKCMKLKELDLSMFNTSKIKDMRDMFNECHSLTTLNLGTEFFSDNVVNMRGMFNRCRVLESLDLSMFNTSKVRDMSYMFNNCNKLHTLILGNNFATSNVTDMERIFCQLHELTSLDLGDKFDTSKVISMESMFFECMKLITLDLGDKFDTSKVETMDGMFYKCHELRYVDVSNFNTSKVTDMRDMFRDCYKLEELDVSGFDTSKVTNMRAMFCNMNNIRYLDVSGFDTSKVTNMYAMFYYCLLLEELDVSNFNTGNAIDMSSMFHSCEKLKVLDVSNFDTSNATNLEEMFYKCQQVEELDVSNFSTSNVTNFSSMFYKCILLKELDLGYKFDTSKATDMHAMFSYLQNLESLDLGNNFKTSNVENFKEMFYKCEKLEEIDVSKFDTSKATNMASMFSYCRKVKKLDVSNFNTSDVTDMHKMFSKCQEIKALDISNFDMANVVDADDMFYDDDKLFSIKLPSNVNATNATLPYSYYHIADEEGHIIDETIDYEYLTGKTSDAIYLRINLRLYVNDVDDDDDILIGLIEDAVCGIDTANKVTHYFDTSSMSEADLNYLNYTTKFLATYLEEHREYADNTTLVDDIYAVFNAVPRLTSYKNMYLRSSQNITLKISPFIDGNTYKLYKDTTSGHIEDITVNTYTLSDITNENSGAYFVTTEWQGYELMSNLVYIDISTLSDISNENISCDKITDITYTGLSNMPEPILKNGEDILEKDIDYTLSYDNNVNVGIASIIVTGIGEFTGTREINFNIIPMQISIDDVTLEYDEYIVKERDGNSLVTSDMNLSFVNTNTNEKVNCIYEEGRYVKEGEYVIVADNANLSKLDIHVIGITSASDNYIIDSLEKTFTNCGGIVDTTKPKIIKIYSNKGTYAMNDSIDFTIEFDEEVKVEDTDVALKIKGAKGEEKVLLDEKEVYYDDDNEYQKEKTFSYVVQKGEFALNGLELVGISITGNGFEDICGNALTDARNIDDLVRNFNETYIEAGNILEISAKSENLFDIEEGVGQTTDSSIKYIFKFKTKIADDTFTLDDIIFKIDGSKVDLLERGVLTTKDNKTYELEIRDPLSLFNLVAVSGSSREMMTTRLVDASSSAARMNALIKSVQTITVAEDVTSDINDNMNSYATYTVRIVNQNANDNQGSGTGSSKPKNPSFSSEMTIEFNPNKKVIAGYMTGYKDNTFRPNENMTRAEISAIIARISDDYSDDKNYKNNINYNDISNNHWASNYIGFAKEKGIITGFKDNTFRPSENMTRAELAVVIIRFLEKDVNSVSKAKFTDIENRWYQSQVSALSELGYINGYPDNTFRGNNGITRAEVCKIINNIIEVSVTSDKKEEYKAKLRDEFKDINTNSWYFNEVLEALY